MDFNGVIKLPLLKCINIWRACSLILSNVLSKSRFAHSHLFGF
mgnify:CR=1 FL=1